jgi:hypothetical protein
MPMTFYMVMDWDSWWRLVWDTLDVPTLQEVGNGLWFILGLEICASIVFYLVASHIEHKRRDREAQTYILMERGPWYERADVQLAVGLLVYVAGSSIRAHWNWVLRECENDYGREACAYLQLSYGELFLAMALAILGGTCMIRRLLPAHWSPWSWLVAGGLAILIPVGYRWVW